MSLTGTPFLALLAVLALGAFVGVVLLWPRLGGPGWLRLGGRAGSLLLVNVLVLTWVAAQMNAQYLFFADWTDLKGALSGRVSATAVSRGAGARQAAERVVKGVSAQAPASLAPLPGSSQGAEVSIEVTGPLSGLRGTVYVGLPPGYASPAEATRRYPVVETFQGYPGSPQQWLGLMHLRRVIDQAVAEHRMGQAIVVSPQVEIPSGVDTECVNGSAGYPQLETWLTQDVPNWLAAHFRVRTQRDSWATMGFSAGGWCAAMATMLHPAQYGAAVVLGGYFRPSFSPTYDAFPPHSPLAHRYDLVSLASRRPPPVALWVETSHADSLSYGTTAKLLQAARSPLSVYATVLQHAGHRISLWRPLVPKALAWLGSRLPGFAPTA